jgi:hypothetical protein
MTVYIINRELYREKQYQIMTGNSYGFNHVFPGQLFTLNQAIEICKEHNFNIANIGNIWQCISK